MIQGRTVNYPLFGGVIPEFWSVIPDESIQLSQVSQLVSFDKAMLP